MAAVSVVIPCYCCSKTIKRSLQSIENQILKPAEVILIDDASGDGTLAVLQALENEYPNWIKVIALEKNAGAASARNAGWAIASQPYIAFLDADDSWHVDKLRIQFEYMTANQDAVLSGHQCVVLEDKPPLPKIEEDYAVTEINGRSLLMRNAFSTPTVMLKRDIAFRFKYGKRHAEDLLLWQQIAFAGLRVVRLECPLAYVHKPLFGVGGLSANLWKMEKGELSNLVILYRSGLIGVLSYCGAAIFSLAKFARRIAISKFRAFDRKMPESGRF
ncbi:MAG: glycosyltransferase family 2 protein [Sideroxydans sp.]|nr:glycosyltransferase family 2 protein [Sideroxydans sp.]